MSQLPVCQTDCAMKDQSAGGPVQQYSVQYLPRSPRPGRVSRRTFLVASGAVVAAAAGGGVALGLTSGDDSSTAPLPTHAPAPGALDDLAAAVAAERALLAGTAGALRSATGARRAALRAVHTDHAAHLAALRSAMRDLAYPNSVPPRLRRNHPVAAQWGPAAESRAARVAAGRALRLDGAASALLASIAACEATHAELLT